MVPVSYNCIHSGSLFKYPLDNDLHVHVHVSVIVNHPPSLVVTDSLCYRRGETPLVMATRNGHTQVVDFLKSRLPQGEYWCTVTSLRGILY